jgi:hypothetical protein
MRRHFTRGLILLCVLCAVPVVASQVRQMTWDDLKPVVEFEDPFTMLTTDQLGNLGMVARVREMKTADRKVSEGELDGKTIRMPGFVLPIEYAGTRVTEFLLVPWVGACIHTPPPPANQIVHVVVDEGSARESKGMFEPVWVTGDMFTKATVQNLYLKDGSGDVSIGYTLTARLVEPYEK